MPPIMTRGESFVGDDTSPESGKSRNRPSFGGVVGGVARVSNAWQRRGRCRRRERVRERPGQLVDDLNFFRLLEQPR